MAAENNLLFSAARKPATENKLFSAASGRQKKLAENKALFSAARAWPPKIAYFRRLAPWPTKITDYFRWPDSQPPEIKNAENKIPIFGGQGPPKITNFRAKKLKKAKNNRISYKIHTIPEISYNNRKIHT